MSFRHPIWLAQWHREENIGLDSENNIFIKLLSIFNLPSWIWPSYMPYQNASQYQISCPSTSSFSSAGNVHLGMDGSSPEPGLVGVEDGGHVLQLPLRQLPVVRKQHRGSTLDWRWRRTLRFGKWSPRQRKKCRKFEFSSDIDLNNGSLPSANG